jgi:hypothetical protein
LMTGAHAHDASGKTPRPRQTYVSALDS